MKLPPSCMLGIVPLVVDGVLANCEHAHFHAPPAAGPVLALPGGPDAVLLLLRRCLPVLTPETRSLRTRLDSDFSDHLSSGAVPTWLLLDGLSAGQRYEARACYAATPTAIRLDVFELASLGGSPDLVESLASYLDRRRPSVSPNTTAAAAILPSREELELAVRASPATPPPQPHDADSNRHRAPAAPAGSVLLLRVLAAADYFTHHPDLMAAVPPTMADIILDPWLGAVIPRTAVPIVAYVVAVGAVAWLLGRALATGLESIALGEAEEEKKTN